MNKLLLLILILHSSVVKSVNSSVCSRLNTSGDSCHSFWILLFHSFAFLSNISSIYLILSLDLIFKCVHILVDIYEASTLCRVLILLFLNIWASTIIRWSYVQLIIILNLINFLCWVILYFAAIQLIVLRLFHFFVQSFRVVIVILEPILLVAALNSLFWLTKGWTFSFLNSTWVWYWSYLLSKIGPNSILHHVHIRRWLTGVGILMSFLLILTIKCSHIASNHTLIVCPLLILLHLLVLLRRSEIEGVRLNVLSLNLAPQALLLQRRTHSLWGRNWTSRWVGLMGVVLLAKYFACVLYWVCIRYWIYMAILTYHMSLFFASADTILSLSCILGIIMTRIILILKIICLIVRLLHLSRPISFGHVVAYHVASCTNQFAFSLVLLGLVNTIWSNSWARFHTLLS